VEIIRVEAQFLDLGEQASTRRLTELMDIIGHAWSRDDHPRPLRIFRGEQRAIGEEMIRIGPEGRQCMGFAAFRRAQGAPGSESLIQLREDVTAFMEADTLATGRVRALQHALIDLVDFLDPDCERFPAAFRGKD
jgi:hypothetical protein